MSKTILIPTDFSLLSLKSVQATITDHPNEKLDIVLVHGVHLSDSITDLLYFSKKSIVSQLSNDEFDNACKLMQQLFNKNVNSLRIELFTGFTQSAFNAFLSGLQIDCIYVPAFDLKLNHRISSCLANYIERADLSKVKQKGHIQDYGQETNVFSQINFAK